MSPAACKPLDWVLALDSAELKRLPAQGPLLLVCQRELLEHERAALMARLLERRQDWRGPEPQAAEEHLSAGGAWLAFAGKDLGAGALGEQKALIEAAGWVGLALRCGAAVQALRVGAGKRHPWMRALGLHKPQRWESLPLGWAERLAPRLRGALSAALSPGRLRSLPSEREGAELLLLRFWLLARRGRAGSKAPGLRHRLRARQQRPLASALPMELLEAELQALPPEAKLASGAEMDCWVASADGIPNLLREIGRLREEAFRAVGEGSGQPLDLDRFDRHYLHLFLWHRQERCLVGAYRFARVDRVLAGEGLDGLYTHSLLRFKPALLQSLEPALELGRSFVVPRFQRGYGPLLLLWRGLGAWLAAHPRYRRLFGLVSMSADFQPLSRELVASFAKQHLFRRDLARLTRPLRPFRPAYIANQHDALTWRLGSDLDEISAWVSELEPDGKGLPVLLRQYAGLGAFFFGFNVDPAFGGALDGLICVDLAHSDPRMLARTMGPAAAQAFLARHGGSGVFQATPALSH